MRAGSRLVQPTRQHAGVSYRGRAYYRGIIAAFPGLERCQVEAQWICAHQHRTQESANACAIQALRIVQEAK